MALWNRVRARRGQVAVEYVLALAGLLAVGTVIWTLAQVTARDAERTARLVANDCP